VASAVAAASTARVDDPQRSQLLLEARARAVARRSEQPSEVQLSEFVLFNLQQETFAIELRYLLEVRRLGFLTKVPSAPEHLAGLVNWRGTALPVFDLTPFFDAPATALPSDPRLLVLGEDEPQFGLIVGAHLEVRSMALPADSSDWTVPNSPLAQHIRGDLGNHTWCLDGASLLQDPRLFLGNR